MAMTQEEVGQEALPQSAMTPEEMAMIKEKVMNSQAEFDMRNQVNGLTTHILTALINGKVSYKGEYNVTSMIDDDFDQDFQMARKLASRVYAGNKNYVNEGVKELEKGE
jgi:hypothetical protein